MARVLRPGFAFAVVCDRGFVVGLHTHRDKLMGYLIWLSRDTYDQMPTVDDARGVTDWRWCVFYPLGSAINKDVDIPIGQIDIPTRLQSFPRMRAGGGPQPWYQYDGGDFTGLGEPCRDPTLPIRQIVNDTMLREMLNSDWSPDQSW